MAYNEDPAKALFWQRNELKTIIKECLREESGIDKEPDIDVLDIVEAAELLHLSKPTIYKHTRLGLLKKLYPEIRKNLYHRDELLRYKKDYRKK